MAINPTLKKLLGWSAAGMIGLGALVVGNDYLTSRTKDETTVKLRATVVQEEQVHETNNRLGEYITNQYDLGELEPVFTAYSVVAYQSQYMTKDGLFFGKKPITESVTDQTPFSIISNVDIANKGDKIEFYAVIEGQSLFDVIKRSADKHVFVNSLTTDTMFTVYHQPIENPLELTVINDEKRKEK